MPLFTLKEVEVVPPTIGHMTFLPDHGHLGTVQRTIITQGPFALNR